MKKSCFCLEDAAAFYNKLSWKWSICKMCLFRLLRFAHDVWSPLQCSTRSMTTHAPGATARTGRPSPCAMARAAWLASSALIPCPWLASTYVNAETSPRAWPTWRCAWLHAKAWASNPANLDLHLIFRGSSVVSKWGTLCGPWKPSCGVPKSLNHQPSGNIFLFNRCWLTQKANYRSNHVFWVEKSWLFCISEPQSWFA